MATGGFMYEEKPSHGWQHEQKAGGSGSGSGAGGGGSTTSRGDAFDGGVQAGKERAERHGLFDHMDADAAEAIIAEQLDSAARVLGGAEVSPRFVELFAELVTVASLSRVAYGEEPLDEPAIEDAAERSAGFFNSWRHA